ncbi:hypothetical protein PSN45_003183 [Yamadazyma tenuis]|uniref:Uncharacterized protein n=1 Tax=Candida tenuis (strain ATCC 10573 / BCRC 21748 / CBS 615 / JCM 9827 / NBRC 10315 / NRRL Y-1498 / VKM Y-70) TaxID=590646 RepID=G3AZ41_CANTC|nr:uncharacterized protein CANTEDRAFT_133432 [Yamadazyma tenuis ATCC 10573]EGV66001.1 hypothetical protein CANTEDRAFT_133432 [Yamadazyma tenuis ATCC 10573]WEJ95659.1 hypothetical protein PSN45_003183 [Yamadazyma tenuis]
MKPALLRHLKCLTSLLAVSAAFTITLEDQDHTNDDSMLTWLTTRRPLEIATINDLDPESLYKTGVVIVKDTKSIILPDGDYIDIESFGGGVPIIGDETLFAEYSFKKTVLHTQSVSRPLGSALDNSRSTVANSVSYSVSASSGKTFSLIASVSAKLVLQTAFEAELDISKGTPISVQATCNVPAGKKAQIIAVISLVKVNVEKRLITLSAYKNFSDCLKGLVRANPKSCLKPNFGYELEEWERTELEFVKSVTSKCTSLD